MRDPSNTAEPLSFEGFDHGSNYEGLYVNAEHQFAFCLIEKNACTEWNELLIGKLEGMDAQWAVQDVFNASVAQEVFSNPFSVRAVFVRDPLERFLSAFLSKCTDECDNAFCFPRVVGGKTGAISFQEAIDWLVERDVAELDGHFRSQAHHCELYKRLHEYNVMGVMSARNLGTDASCLLENVGLQRLNVKGGNEPYWPNMRDANATLEHETASLLQKYYTPETAQLVMQAYAVDYDLFGLVKPPWVDAATGEWIDQKTCGDTSETSSLLEVLDR